MIKQLLALCALLALPSTNLLAKAIGKAELAPAYIHLDIIAMKHTVKELDMPGERAEIFYVTENGWMGKITDIYGQESDGIFSSVALSIGRTIPFREKWIITPSIGLSYTSMISWIDIRIPSIGKIRVRDKFKALAPFISLEAVYSFRENLRASASVQYAWSHPHTNIIKLLSSKSNAQGPNYGLSLEYDVNKQWSVNIGAGYNESFSQEKNGIRIRGLKIGVARWF